MVVEYMYFTPFVHGIMQFLKALPVPNFESSNNSLKRKRHEMVVNEVIKGLKSGENFLLYPAGRLKHSAIEKIGGASATHRIVQEAPEANIVLVRIKGLWGSSFSRALTGSVPPLGGTIKKGLWVILKNLIFFTPRREIIVELEPAPHDFPCQANRLELNRWLEKWYNKPDGLTPQEGEYPGDSLILRSYSFWRKEIPEVYKPKQADEIVIPLTDIDQVVYDKVMAKLVDLTELELAKIKPEMSLANDLGLDSLDISELAMFIQDKFETNPIPVTELTTVERVLAFASKKREQEEKVEEEQYDLSKWKYKGPASLTAKIFQGETIPEVFLNVCEERGNSPAYADMRSGILTYSRLKLAVILLAEKFRHMPGRYIGILLPASAGAFICVLACQLAGKIPLMINWTIGPRHLQAVSQLSNVEVVLTSWAFLERLDTVDLSGIDDKLVMLETVRRGISIFDKIKALIRSKKSAKNVLKIFGTDKLSKDDAAVLLFTSGSEALPKGVPLSHHNILSNQRSALQVVKLYTDDVLLAFLPPFHSFGFCLTGLIGLLSGVRTAFYPNPTDGKGLMRAFEYWGATLTAGAPTFIKSMLKASKPHQLNTMRMCVTGAERTPQDLIDLIDKFGKKHCLVEGYGITECSPILSANQLGQPLRGVGRPLPGVELLIVHLETHEVLPQGSEGLILARGPNVFSGYLNPGLASPFMMVEGKEWYNTGDIGYLDEENYLFISGRKKRFIKVGGEMVSLQAIESALLSAAQERNWLIRSEGPTLGVIAHEVPGSKPMLLLVTTFVTDADEVNQTIRKSGFSNMIRIADVITLEEIPLMGTGKINYRVLEEEYFASERQLKKAS
jgi:long-chain-fatty-acid--[acyl-carrier-protein] ligase